MGGSRIFLLIIAAVMFSGLASMLPFMWSGSDALSSSYREMAARELESNARLFALAMAANPGMTPGEELKKLAASARAVSDTRYTVILADGTVAADSDEDAARMENHRNRPEIGAALAGGTDVEIRSSPTLGTDWMYVAVPLPGGAVIRAASSMEEQNGRLALWWWRGLGGFLVSIAILTIMALLVSRMISRPIETAVAGAERYAAGDLSYRLPATGTAEMRRLAGAMSAMAGELDARFRMVTRQREEMAAVFENMSEGILAVDDAGQILLVNSAAGGILGTPDIAAGTDVGASVRNADLLDAIRETAAAGDSLEREVRVQRDADAESLVQVHTARMREDGGDMGVLAVLRDVTRIRRLETMRRDFVANVSHELRTPITAIQSCLETIIEDGPDGDGAGFAEMALRNTRRMGAIIDNLLLLAGMESGAGGTAVTVGAGPVGPILDEAVSLCGDEARARNITFAVDRGEHVAALMNPPLVTHALVNLVDNAIKYGPEGGTIAIAARHDGDRVRITVSDQGPGIASRHRDRVFERFYRVDGAARIQKGSGLGLAIVKHIALSQGGDITLESEIGAGSRFTLDLPRG